MTRARPERPARLSDDQTFLDRGFFLEIIADFTSQVLNHIAWLLAPALQRLVAVVRQTHIARNASDAFLARSKLKRQVWLTNERPSQR